MRNSLAAAPGGGGRGGEEEEGWWHAPAAANWNAILCLRGGGFLELLRILWGFWGCFGLDGRMMLGGFFEILEDFLRIF